MNGLPDLDATSKKWLVPVTAGVHGCEYLVEVTSMTSNAKKVLHLEAVLPVLDQ